MDMIGNDYNITIETVKLGDVNALSPGLFSLPLNNFVTLEPNSVYYFAMYNQINGSRLGGRITGTGTTANAPPINFRSQNLPGFTVGQNINISDQSLKLSPWLAGYSQI